MDQAGQTLKATRIIAVAGFSLLLLFYFNHGVSKKAVVQSYVASEVFPGAPLRLKIPAINVSAEVQSVGLNSKGEMDVPSNTTDVAWFKLGQRPGENGSAVIAGHLNGQHGEVGVFADLNKLTKGDKVSVEDDNGTSISFVVREIRKYDSQSDTADVFGSHDGQAHLNFITCAGVWNTTKKSYSNRLIVFTDKEW